MRTNRKTIDFDNVSADAKFVINRIVESEIAEAYDSLISLDSVEDLIDVCSAF